MDFNQTVAEFIAEYFSSTNDNYQIEYHILNLDWCGFVKLIKEVGFQWSIFIGDKSYDNYYEILQESVAAFRDSMLSHKESIDTSILMSRWSDIEAKYQ